LIRERCVRAALARGIGRDARCPRRPALAAAVATVPGAADGSSSLLAQVDDHANGRLDLAGTAAVLTGVEPDSAPIFGAFVRETAPRQAPLALRNHTLDPADLPRDEFACDDGMFLSTDLSAFHDVVPGGSHALGIVLDARMPGALQDQRAVDLFGCNAGGFERPVAMFRLRIRAPVSALPLPGAVRRMGGASNLVATWYRFV
jgi:hypothetical protein